MAKFAVSLLLALAVVGSSLAAPKSSKVPQLLQDRLDQGHVLNIILSISAGTKSVLSSIRARSISDRATRITTLVSALQSHASVTQAPVMHTLGQFPSLVVRTYWISNQIYVRGATAEVVEKLAAMNEVEEIHEEKIFYIDEPINHSVQDGGVAPMAEWGINNINAPEAWELGFEGEGAVVATIDTGVRKSHESLDRNYVDNGYGWYDPYSGTSAPSDTNGHGTHTTANIAGTFGVGVAPKAKWMSCKGCSTSSCTEDALIRCGQWVNCPTWTDGSSPDCSKAPDVVSCSWGGGQGDAFYERTIDAWHVSDITPVFAIGNSGPNCDTANSPGDQPRVIGVGASSQIMGLAYFSSKGPSIEGLVKPDISAPGENIRSASNLGNSMYATNSGMKLAKKKTCNN